MPNEYTGYVRTIQDIQPCDTIMTDSALNRLKFQHMPYEMKERVIQHHLHMQELNFEEYRAWEKKFDDCRKKGFKTEESKNKMIGLSKDPVDESCKECGKDPTILIVYNRDIKEDI